MSGNYVDAASVVVPVTINDTVLISSNVSETEHAAWTSGATYGLAERRIYQHAIWESLQAANTNHPPDTSPTWWGKVQATNAFAMFDERVATQTTNSAAISVRLRPAQVANCLAALNCTGGNLRVRTIDPVALEVYNKVTGLRSRPPRSSYYAWFFQRRVPINDFIALDLPAYPNADVYVDLSVTSGNVGIGHLVLGQQIVLADGIQLGARVGDTDYSDTELNKWGIPTFVERAPARRGAWTMTVPNDRVDYVINVLRSRKNRMSLWVGYSGIKATCIWGWIRDFEVTIRRRVESDIAVEIQGAP